MKSFLVLGMGAFGKFLAQRLLELKNDVMIIDKDEEIIEELSPMFTNAQIGDCTNENVLRSLGVEDFDACFVAMDEDFQSSLITTSLLNDLGAKRVVSKSSREIQSKLLLRNGADEVIYPEKDIATKVAMKYSTNNVLDFVQLSQDFAIFETAIPIDWAGKSIIELDIRRKHNVNILAVKSKDIINPAPSPDYIFSFGDHIFIMGKQNDVGKLTSKNK